MTFTLGGFAPVIVDVPSVGDQFVVPIAGPKGDPGEAAYNDMPDLTLQFENGLV